MLARLLGTGLLVLACAAPTAGAALQPAAFEAVYDVYLDGKRRMETRISLAGDGGDWLLTSHGKGVKGLARILQASTRETARMRWQDNTVVPLEFSHQSRVAGREDGWSASFDWAQQQVSTKHEDGDSTLALTAGTQDPASLTQLMRVNLEQGMRQWRVQVVDEDAIDEHLYRAESPETLQTALGCLATVPLTRIRENSKRYSQSWHAPALEFLPVRIQHGKHGGREFDLRIRQLTIGGRAVEPDAGCD